MDVANCPICFEINGKTHKNHSLNYSKIIKKRQNIIWSDNNIVIIPSIGPLNESHILIIPIRHITSFSCMNEKEYNSVKLAKSFIENFHKNTIFFEHGTGTKYPKGSAASITHAHIHAINIKDDKKILNILKNELGAYRIEFLDLIGSLSNFKKNYLFYKSIEGENYFVSDPDIPSQFLRMKIGDIVKCSEWNWRISPSYDLVGQVIDYYKN